MYLQTLLLATLFAFTKAAEEAESSGSCFIKAGVPKYSYDPTSGKGPMDWGSIDGFETCGTGQAQSPIDFSTSVSYAPLDDGPKPSIMVADMELSSGSFNWAMNCPTDADCGSTEFVGKTFKLINIHFHSPSEHTLNGTQFPLEAHMVHASDDGQLAVIATMFEYVDEESYQYQIFAGAKEEFGQNAMLAAILRNLRNDRTKFPVFLGNILDANKGYCTYVGSLTTPPCTEGVTFLMANNVKSVTKRQVSEYLLSAGAGFDGNNRPVQPTNDREITCYVL